MMKFLVLAVLLTGCSFTQNDHYYFHDYIPEGGYKLIPIKPTRSTTPEDLEVME